MKKLSFLHFIKVLSLVFVTSGYSQNITYPYFNVHDIDTLKSGYKVETEDINLDGKPDVAALASTPSALLWFENPGWKRHIICSDTYLNISMAFNDIDGDGMHDVALASHFNLPEPERESFNG